MASRTVSFIGGASANTLGFGFIRYASPGAATRRGGKKLADDAGVRRNAAGHQPGRRIRMR
jgi:hypothetical protein